jgi:invasion protein IalB
MHGKGVHRLGSGVGGKADGERERHERGRQRVRKRDAQPRGRGGFSEACRPAPAPECNRPRRVALLAGHLPVTSVASGFPSSTTRHGIAAIRPLLPATRSWHKEHDRDNIGLTGTGPILQGKVNSNMAHSFLHSGVGARIARAGAFAATIALGGLFLLNVVYPVSAQAQAKKAPPKAASSGDGSWVKLCDKQTLKGKDKEGKEVSKDVDMCVTLNELIHPDTGMVMVSARLQQVKIDGKEKDHFSVTVPLGVALPVQPSITVFPKDMWDKIHKNGKLDKGDETKLKHVKLVYTHCIQVGCNAEVEANADLINTLKTGAGFFVETVRMPGTPVGQPLTLNGFDKALAGPPTETKKYAQARTELMKQIYERQKQMLAEMKKQQDELHKMQPNVGTAAKKK